MDRVKVATSLDTLLYRKSIVRLPNETFEDVVKRYNWINANTPDYTLRTLAGNISNELGITPTPYIKIELVKTANEYVDGDVFIQVLPNKISISTTALESELMFTNTTTVNELVTFLNLFSSVFTVTSLPSIDLDSLARNILPTSNLQRYKNVKLESSTGIKLFDELIYDYIFSDSVVYSNEVNDADLLISDGDYLFDRKNGNIISVAKGRGYIYYNYYSPRLVLYHSPIKIYDFSHEYSYLYDEGITDLGIRSYNRLLDAYGIEWE